jgi:transposase
MRQERSRPLIVELQTWLREQRARLSKNSDATKATNYSLNRWDAFTRFLDNCTFMGARSYSIYLCHVPLIGLVLYALASGFVDPSESKVFFVLLVTVTPLTWALAYILYGMIEWPGIQLAKLISKQWGATLPQNASFASDPGLELLTARAESRPR